MSQTLFIIGAGIEAIPGIRKAKEMGLRVVVSDMNPHAPGFAEADDKIIASTYDVKSTVDAAIQYNKTVRTIDGVICIASDVPLTVASVAEALNLQGISVESARLGMDKLDMKRRFAEDKIPVPWFSPVHDFGHLRELKKKERFPLVMKPVDSCGARGVLRLTPEVDLAWAYEVSKSCSPTSRIMLERFLPGPQVSTESIVIEGRTYTPGFSDRNYEYLEHYAPHIIENGGELPSHLSAETQQAVRDLVQEAAQSIGVSNGVIKGDIVVFEGRPHVIELAPRLSGGYFCTHEIPLNTGVDFVGHAIRLALGEMPSPTDLMPLFQRNVAQRYLFPTPGRVVSISGDSEVEQRKDIVFSEIRVEIGDIVKPVNSHPERAGVLMAIGDTRQKAIDNAISAVNEIKIETVPVD